MKADRGRRNTGTGSRGAPRNAGGTQWGGSFQGPSILKRETEANRGKESIKIRMGMKEDR